MSTQQIWVLKKNYIFYFSLHFQIEAHFFKNLSFYIFTLHYLVFEFISMIQIQILWFCFKISISFHKQTCNIEPCQLVLNNFDLIFKRLKAQNLSSKSFLSE